MKKNENQITLDDFDSLYRKFGPMVMRRCQYIMKDEEKAFDCMQDVFVRIIEYRKKLFFVGFIDIFLHLY